MMPLLVFVSEIEISNTATSETEAMKCLLFVLRRDDLSTGLLMEIPNATWLLARAGLH